MQDIQPTTDQQWFTASKKDHEARWKKNPLTPVQIVIGQDVATAKMSYRTAVRRYPEQFAFGPL